MPHNAIISGYSGNFHIQQLQNHQIIEQLQLFNNNPIINQLQLPPHHHIINPLFISFIELMSCVTNPMKELKDPNAVFWINTRLGLGSAPEGSKCSILGEYTT